MTGAKGSNRITLNKNKIVEGENTDVEPLMFSNLTAAL